MVGYRAGYGCPFYFNSDADQKCRCRVWRGADKVSLVVIIAVVLAGNDGATILSGWQHCRIAGEGLVFVVVVGYPFKGGIESIVAEIPDILVQLMCRGENGGAVDRWICVGRAVYAECLLAHNAAEAIAGDRGGTVTVVRADQRANNIAGAAIGISGRVAGYYFAVMPANQSANFVGGSIAAIDISGRVAGYYFAVMTANQSANFVGGSIAAIDISGRVAGDNPTIGRSRAY